MTTRVYREESARDYKNESPTLKKILDDRERAIGRIADRVQRERDAASATTPQRPAGEPDGAAAARAARGVGPLERTKGEATAAPAPAAPPPRMPRPRPAAPAGMPAGWTHPENGMGPLGKHGK